MLGFVQNINKLQNLGLLSNGGVFSVCGFGHSALNACVECGHTLCAYIKLTFCLHHARHILSSLHSGVVLS